MRIAQVAPLTEAIPPKLYGGTERVVHWLTEELVALGHDVTLFASGDSQTSAKLEACWPRALRLDGSVRDANALHMAMLETGAAAHRRVRLPAFSSRLLSVLAVLASIDAVRSPRCMGVSICRSISPSLIPFSDVPVISISNSQRRPLPQANWIRTVYHGLPEKMLMPQPAKPSYFAFLGRIAPEKRVDRAIHVAEHCGVPLKIAAKIDRADRDYYDEADQAAARSRAQCRIHRRDRRQGQGCVPERRDRAARPDRLAGAVRARDDRGDGLRLSGDRVQSRVRA